MRKKTGRAIVCVITGAFFVLISTSAIYAASVSAKLHVQVTILPYLDYRIIETRSLHVNTSDIRKGFKNVENGTILSISTNDTNGYVLSVSSQALFGYGGTQADELHKGNGHDAGTDFIDANAGNLYTSVTITVDGSAYTIPAGGSVDILIPFEGMGHKIKKLSYSFELAPEATKGTYNLPIIFTPLAL